MVKQVADRCVKFLSVLEVQVVQYVKAVLSQLEFWSEVEIRLFYVAYDMVNHVVPMREERPHKEVFAHYVLVIRKQVSQ